MIKLSLLALGPAVLIAASLIGCSGADTANDAEFANSALEQANPSCNYDVSITKAMPGARWQASVALSGTPQSFVDKGGHYTLARFTYAVRKGCTITAKNDTGADLRVTIGKTTALNTPELTHTTYDPTSTIAANTSRVLKAGEHSRDEVVIFVERICIDGTESEQCIRNRALMLELATSKDGIHLDPDPVFRDNQ